MSGLSLYQLADEYRYLMELASDPEADEDSFDAAIKALAGEFRDKAVSVAQVAKNFAAAAEQIRKAAAEMTKRADVLNKREERIKRYLLGEMEKTGINRIESPYFPIAIRSGPPRVIVTDEHRIPSEFMRHVPEQWEPDKIAIRQALQDGERFNWAHLEQSKRVEFK